MEKSEISSVIEIELAKEIFMNDEQMYKKFLFQFVDRDFFIKLQDAVAQKNAEEAFAYAHDIKGIVQSLAFIDLGTTISETVEILRVGNIPSEDVMSRLMKAYNTTIDCIKYIKENSIGLF